MLCIMGLVYGSGCYPHGLLNWIKLRNVTVVIAAAIIIIIMFYVASKLLLFLNTCLVWVIVGLVFMLAVIFGRIPGNGSARNDVTISPS